MKEYNKHFYFLMFNSGLSVILLKYYYNNNNNNVATLSRRTVSTFTNYA